MSASDQYGGDQSAVTSTSSSAPEPTMVPSRDGMVIVFVNDDASEVEIAAIRQRLEGLVGSGSVRYLIQDDACAEFSAMFKDRPEVVAKTSPSDLPRSLRVKPAGSAAAMEIADAVWTWRA